MDNVVIAILGSSAFTGIVLKVLEAAVDRWSKGAREKREAQVKALADLTAAVESLKEDNRVIMHDRLFCLFEEFGTRDALTAGERANVDYLFDRYRGIGGNHHAEIYYNLLAAKPIKPEEGGEDYEQ